MQEVEGAKEKKLNGRVKRSGFRMSEHGDVVLNSYQLALALRAL